MASSVEIDDNSLPGVVRAADLPVDFQTPISNADLRSGETAWVVMSPSSAIRSWIMSTPKAVYFSRMDSPAGKLLLAATDQGLRFLLFDKGKLPRSRKDEVWIESQDKLRPYQEQLQAYFRGELREFTCKLDLIGTEFQKKCWNALLAIPYGKTTSYAGIAQQVGSPRAFRAVGQANHNNPIAIIVPCHRVITSSGTLGGYGGGLEIKDLLLKLEGVAGFDQEKGGLQQPPLFKD
jgi:methylated-DNA-[protein]-cysteine S-methyltransferase